MEKDKEEEELDTQPSLDLLDKIFSKARENAARAVGEDVLAGAEVFLRWNCAASNWCIELFPSHCIAKKFSMRLEKKNDEKEPTSPARLGDFCHEFTRWCPPIDRGIVPSAFGDRNEQHPQSSESTLSFPLWLGPLVSFEDASRVHFPRSLFTKPKAAELLLLGFTSTQLQVIDIIAHTEAVRTTFARTLELNDKLADLQKKLKERMKARNLSKADAASFTASIVSLMKEREKVNKEKDDAGRTIVPVLPFSAESLEELEVKFDLLFFP